MATLKIRSLPIAKGVSASGKAAYVVWAAMLGIACKLLLCNFGA